MKSGEVEIEESEVKIDKVEVQESEVKTDEVEIQESEDLKCAVQSEDTDSAVPEDMKTHEDAEERTTEDFEKLSEQMSEEKLLKESEEIAEDFQSESTGFVSYFSILCVGGLFAFALFKLKY